MKSLKVIKIGGNIIDDQKSLDDFLETFTKIEDPKILVHGGGKIASEMARSLDIPVKMFEGRRITDEATLDIITMVYAGKINKIIVAKLQSTNCNALGLTGADGNTIEADKRPVLKIDYGYVGDVKKVNFEIIETLISNNITPVFCAITHNKEGQLLNTNADTIATEIAMAFADSYNVELYYCFEKNGVLEDIIDEDSVIEQIDSISFKNLVSEGIIADGMLPKISNCINAVNHNVDKVCIGKHDKLFTNKKGYTTIVK